MEEKKKKKIKKNLTIGGIVFLIVFVIITAIVINYQKQKLDNINSSNENIPKIEKIL